MISQRYIFTSIQTILSKFYRDLKDTSISQDDLIEWIGEAMGFMKMPQIQEEVVSFLEVKDYQVRVPRGFQSVIQIAKDRTSNSLQVCKSNIANECPSKTVTDKVCERYQSGTENVYNTSVTFSTSNIGIVIATGPNQIAFVGGTLTGTFLNGGRLTVGACSTETYTVDFSNAGMVQLSGVSMSFMNCLVANGILPNLNTGTQNNSIPSTSVKLESKTVQPVYNHRQLVRYRKYKDNTLLETSYEDCNGASYQLVGTIVNCPDSMNCVPCKNYKNDCNSDNILIYNECGELTDDISVVDYFTLRKEEYNWNKFQYFHSFEPVVLTNHSFFNSIVCKDKREIYTQTTGNRHEYTIVGEFPYIALRFSFKEGVVALAYLKTQLDEDGLPLIPDDSSCSEAVFQYLRWKIAQRLSWSGREGFERKSQEAYQLWLKYCKQFKSKTKMPFGIDEHQYLMERQHYVIPNHQKFLGYFGQLTR